MSDEFSPYDNLHKEAGMMADIMSAFDAIEEGRPVERNGISDNSRQVNYEATRDLLYSLHEVTGEYGNIHQEDMNYYDQGGYLTESIDYDDVYSHYEPSENENFIQDLPVRPRAPTQHTQATNVPPPTNRPYVPGKNWSIIEESVMGMKSAKSYSIKCNNTNQVILDNIMMYESALALRQILNDGKTLTDPKVLGIISSGIQYTKVITEALTAAKKRQEVLKESRYDMAQELDVVISGHKQKATELKERVLDFLREEGFITK